MYDDLLRSVLRFLIFLANLAGGGVVGVAIMRGIVAYTVGLVRARDSAGPEEGVRPALGRALSLALEFQVAADILGTALDPTQQDLIILAAVVALRTLLVYFLGRELDAAQRRGQAAGGLHE